jgi:hypothetical protein
MRAVQLKMARAAMGWGVRQLAEKAGVTAFECLYRLMAAVMTEAMDGEFRLAASSSIADGFRGLTSGHSVFRYAESGGSSF